MDSTMLLTLVLVAFGVLGTIEWLKEWIEEWLKKPAPGWIWRLAAPVVAMALLLLPPIATRLAVVVAMMQIGYDTYKAVVKRKIEQL